MGELTTSVRAFRAPTGREATGVAGDAAWVLAATVGTMIIVCGALIGRYGGRR
jgi:hypothetical protein